MYQQAMNIAKACDSKINSKYNAFNLTSSDNPPFLFVPKIAL
jgi:hypothetical protein